MAEYEPPMCENSDCKAYATTQIHIDADHYVDQPAVMLLCSSHQRQRRAYLIKARIPFEAHTI